MAKACKSNGHRHWVTEAYVSGERVRNAWMTYPRLRDSGGLRPFAKVPVIPDDPMESHDSVGKAQAVWERSMSYQLVGGVKAYQGDDGYRV